jgi:hypothetical protein
MQGQHRLRAGVGPIHPVTLALQGLLEEIPDVNVIVHNQNMPFHSSASSRSVRLDTKK